VVYLEGKSKFQYVKRFLIETLTMGKKFPFIGEEKGSELLVASTSVGAEVELTTEKKSGEKVVEMLILDEFMDVKGWKVLGNRLSQDKVKKLVLKSAKVGEAPVVEAKTIASEYIEMDGGDEDMGDSGDDGDEGTSDQGGGTVILGGDGSPQLNLL
jgi:topoisomerase-4 subunit A